MHADYSDWHNPKVTSGLGLHILSVKWKFFNMMKHCCLALTWRASVLRSAHHICLLTDVLCLHWISVERCTKNALLPQHGILLSAAGPRITFWNCKTGGKPGFPLVPPYLIISDSWIAFHFHCVNPGNPSAPNDQLVIWQQRHFGCLGLELSLAST